MTFEKLTVRFKLELLINKREHLRIAALCCKSLNLCEEAQSLSARISREILCKKDVTWSSLRNRSEFTKYTNRFSCCSINIQYSLQRTYPSIHLNCQYYICNSSGPKTKAGHSPEPPVRQALREQCGLLVQRGHPGDRARHPRHRGHWVTGACRGPGGKYLCSQQIFSSKHICRPWWRRQVRDWKNET